MNRLVLFIASCSITSALALTAEPQGVTTGALSFDVASIKIIPAQTGQAIYWFKTTTPTAPLRMKGNRFEAKGTLRDLILDAYGVYDYQIEGLPDWALPGRNGIDYEVIALSEMQPLPMADQIRLMFQKLLADRFQLTLHRETRKLKAYQLIVDKNGPKMKPAGNNEPSTGRLARGEIHMIVLMLSLYLDRPIIDKTGLTGTYEFLFDTRDFRHELGRPKPAPSIFGAVRDQLGLRLESTVHPMDVLIIDDVAKASPN